MHMPPPTSLLVLLLHTSFNLLLRWRSTPYLRLLLRCWILMLHMPSTFDTRRLAASTTICIHFPWSHAWHAMFRIRHRCLSYVRYIRGKPHEWHGLRRLDVVVSLSGVRNRICMYIRTRPECPSQSAP
ncbi:hypothetical protein L227DRAFT_118841 [Lentinus tigrinus ALCF2SS1-6]|uniref:Secreted protein n=1 Tax=Lentinus tigrinus ALCF2SS1-6 TaxID=1328759 RepID=A0A5C2S9W2_9APHY|nr:hypothetical protein L227DRAFT_118841 [Lentinus tigrinus ALCF2SS1-6]